VDCWCCVDTGLGMCCCCVLMKKKEQGLGFVLKLDRNLCFVDEVEYVMFAIQLQKTTKIKDNFVGLFSIQRQIFSNSRIFCIQKDLQSAKRA
jgi:hypothetical protein